MNQNQNKASLLRAIQQTDFALYDTALFLDSHPGNREALSYYKNLNQKCKMLTAQYESAYGPLTRKSAAGGDRWAWMDGPWPWEMEG